MPHSEQLASFSVIEIAENQHHYAIPAYLAYARA
jgi:hypothetical protein